MCKDVDHICTFNDDNENGVVGVDDEDDSLASSLSTYRLLSNKLAAKLNLT